MPDEEQTTPENRLLPVAVEVINAVVKSAQTSLITLQRPPPFGWRTI